MSNSAVTFSSLPKVTPYSQRTREDKRVAEQNHSKTHAELRKLQRTNCNKSCADCTSRLTGWAVLPHGIFVCINCAQVHRSIGRHISMVKAVSTGTYTWYPDELAVMQAVGNATAERLYSVGAPPKPADSEPRRVHETYIRNKYERRKWVQKQAVSASLKSASTSISDPEPRHRRSRSPKSQTCVIDIKKNKATIANTTKATRPPLIPELGSAPSLPNLIRSNDRPLNLIDGDIPCIGSTGSGCKSEYGAFVHSHPHHQQAPQVVDFFASFGV